MATNIVTRTGKGLPLSAADYDQNVESFSGTVDSKTGGYTILDTDQNKTIEFNSASPVTCNLPSTAALIGQLDTTRFRITIKNIGVGLVTISPTNPDTIDGQATVVLTQYKSAEIQINAAGTEWNIISDTKIQGIFVNNANGNPTIDDQLENINSTHTADVWATLGPTASGAANIWTALDSVPDGSEWIEIAIFLRVQGTAGSITTSFHVRRNGSTEIAGNANEIAEVTLGNLTVTGEDQIISSRCTAKVPIDENKIFDALYSETGSAIVSIKLTGYGRN